MLALFRRSIQYTLSYCSCRSESNGTNYSDRKL